MSPGNCKRRRREAAIAEGKKPVPTRGSGERRNFEHFTPKWSAFWDVVNLIFLNNQIEKIVDERSFDLLEALFVKNYYVAVALDHLTVFYNYPTY